MARKEVTRAVFNVASSGKKKWGRLSGGPGEKLLAQQRTILAADGLGHNVLSFLEDHLEMFDTQETFSVDLGFIFGA